MKKQYKNILVAVDGSEQAYNAVSEAAEVAKRNDGKLHILTVKDIGRYYGMAGRVVLTDTLELDKSAEEILDKASHLVTNEVETEIYEVSGVPKYTIADFSKEHDIDLIVIGATGTGFIDKLLVGSTTQYVVSHASCNVMVVR
ncbi:MULTISPECIES: universal stress protein [Lactococcus]|uniref:Universal stress protein n=2 Tax=Lactococcus TaxID=1357 RepID=A0A387BCN3_9LACT|nr:MULTISPECIES: universal stress protein [Lactococcus]AYG00114.1 universal stress protein [Lactococcus allomyrinae]QDK71078.1 universal stress protein [Lactococcus protaetiae]